MKSYQKMVKTLRILINVSVLFVVAGLAAPILIYISRPDSQINMTTYLEDGEKNSGINWIAHHEKMNIQAFASGHPVMITSGREFATQAEKFVDHNAVIMEMLFSKVAQGSKDAEALQNVTGVSFSGFTGKSFRDLGNVLEIPEKLMASYEMVNGEKWTFSGQGVVFFNDSSVIVLRKGIDYTGDLSLREGTLDVPYMGYFEVLSMRDEPIASLRLNVTASGAKALSSKGLPSTFPAFCTTSSPLYDGYYFAVELGRYTVDVPYAYAGIDNIMANKLIYNRSTDERAYWQWYVPKLKVLLNQRPQLLGSKNEAHDKVSFLVEGTKIYKVDAQGRKSELFIKGVNLGPALPGKAFTEFPMDKRTYAAWLEQMKSMNVNAVRVYTLLPPAFYQALNDFNTKEEAPIYLLQEIWPEEHPAEDNYLSAVYNKEYQREIARVVGAIHGDANIPERLYRAYGIYNADVSSYVLGYLVGREMEPQEVKATDALNPGYRFDGEYFYSEHNATPTESWLAASCDYVLSVEKNGYDDTHLVAIVSWPTLDPLSHDSEWNPSGDKSLQYNDSVSVDISNIGITKAVTSGFFGAYHIYPNYPDFMNLDSEYAFYTDDNGSFRYGGYLKAFFSQHTKYPAVVAEYGMSTSLATAHFNPDGLSHGGVSEHDQAQDIIRMTNAIKREGYSGAVIFEWMDEWAKKTWTTELYMIPYARHLLWHNVIDPEQNYGILANRASPPVMKPVEMRGMNTTVLKKISFGQNDAFIFVDMDYSDSLHAEAPFQLAIDTASERGQESNWEFLLDVDTAPVLRVNPGYNWTKGRYRAIDSDFDSFENLVQMINKENVSKSGTATPAVYTDLSRLQRGAFTVPQNTVQVSGNRVSIRIPYGLLGISDPSSRQILSDETAHIPTGADGIETYLNERIHFKLIQEDTSVEFYGTMTSWENPDYEEQFKSGFDQIADYFKRLN